MSWISTNMAEFLIIVGLALLAAEILIFGFATLFLLFVGIASIITGTLMYLELIPATFLSGLLGLGVFTALSAIALWQPMKKMQADVDPTDAVNDLIGNRFTISKLVSSSVNPNYKFSGITWKLTSEEEIPAGSEVEITHTDVGLLTVRAVAED